MLVAVVIPIYKSHPNSFERISLKQVLNVLGEFPIRFVMPDNLDVSIYKKLVGKASNVDFRKFDKSYFQGIDGYNKLMLNVNFYRSFQEYRYILIHQLDSFVFKNDLKYWCALNYDYVGAPWLQNIYAWLFSPKGYPNNLILFHKFLLKGRFIKTVGNGGFSLRKVSSFINNLVFFQKAARNWSAYEDSFYSHYVGSFNPFFRIPDKKTALKFSFDQFPDRAFRLNNFEIPFGCHAWYHENEIYQNNLGFWKEYVRKFNPNI